MNLSSYESVYGVRGDTLEVSHLTEQPSGLAAHVAAHQLVVDDLQRELVRRRINAQYRREKSSPPTRTFKIGDTVMLLRPPVDKAAHAAVGPYVVVTVGEMSAYYSVAILGPDGEPTGLPTRAAAGQLRPFDMSRTTPETEYLRLVNEEFGDGEMWPTRAVVGHEPNPTRHGDLLFKVVWITNTGDSTTMEPVTWLMNNEHFKDYVSSHGLEAVVEAQARREKARDESARM
jgi:hypothetical protein